MNPLLVTMLGATLCSAPIDDDRSAQVQWHAPASCPDEATVRRRIDEVVSPTSARTLQVTVEVAEAEEPAESGERYEVTLFMRNADGQSERRFTAEDCALLIDAVVLVVGVTADLAEDDGPPTEPASEAPEPAEVAGPAERQPARAAPAKTPVRPSPPPLPPASPARLGVRAGVAVLAGGGLGPTTHAHGDVGGSVALLGNRWRVDLAALWATPTTAVASGVAGRFDAWRGRARGCYVHPFVAALELPLCGGVEAGRVRGSGLPPVVPSRNAALWLAPLVAGGLSWSPVRSVALGLELELAAATTRAEFTVVDGDAAIPLDRLTPVAARGRAVIELRFGG